MVLKKINIAGGVGGAAGFIANLSIRAKILGGFSAVLVVLCVVAVNSYFSFTNVASGLGHYSEAAEEAALAVKIETNFLKLQGYVREYANSGDPKQVEHVETSAPKLQTAIDNARKKIHDPTHVEKLDEVAREFGDYMSMFTRMRAVKAEHDQLVTGTLFPESEKMVRDLEEIVKHHASSEDSVTLLAKTAHEHAQLLALYAQMMMHQSNEEFGHEVKAEFAAFGKAIENLKRRVINPEDNKLVAEVESLFADFKNTFEKAHKDEVVIYDLSHKAMVKTADVIIKDTEYLETAASETEHAVRAETDSTVITAEVVIGAVSIVGLGVGLLLAFFLGRMISSPISEVTELMNRIADGDTDMEITGTERQDEIGAMNRALVKLRESVNAAFELSQMVEDMPINVIKCDPEKFEINYMNKAAKVTLKTLEDKLPAKVDDMIGQSIDFLHNDPEHQRNVLRDPNKLPIKDNVKLGNDTLNLNFTAIRDKKGDYFGPMLGWSVITEQLNLSEKVLNVVKNVSAAATEMRSAAESMTSTAESTSKQATAVAAASEEAATNVQTVASAAEELSVSVSEINRQVGQSTEVANKANEEATRTNVTVQGLAEAAQKIGEVVNLISEIAEQTNLLALNATIEAARAGEAGKGFAVVASEVKNLANQTAKATEEIGTQVNEMQSVTGDAVSAIKTIGETIAEINSITDLIATAVTEQGNATKEIAENTQQASAGTQEVNRNISGVTQGAQETGASASEVLSAADELSKQAEALSVEVENFMNNIKAA